MSHTVHFVGKVKKKKEKRGVCLKSKKVYQVIIIVDDVCHDHVLHTNNNTKADMPSFFALLARKLFLTTTAKQNNKLWSIV